MIIYLQLLDVVFAVVSPSGSNHQRLHLADKNKKINR
jgi:hypothetical protein